jgi:hypothetical protein
VVGGGPAHHLQVSSGPPRSVPLVHLQHVLQLLDGVQLVVECLLRLRVDLLRAPRFVLAERLPSKASLSEARLVLALRQLH